MAGEMDNATIDMSAVHLYPDMTSESIPFSPSLLSSIE